MSLHLLRPAVGATCLEDVESWFARTVEARVTIHTRRAPTRVAELLDGGSVYWVVKGQIRCRAPILAIEQAIYPETGEQACRLTLQGPPVAVAPVAHRPFQGWRYLEPAKAPPDLASAGDLPAALVAELRELGLL
ncbi:MAG: DUF1489 family protein [Alphaproteobacteria bacterium]|nr:DUF1489 domain-containing protein [Alphaproteobacteria bacterium]TAD88150.1 MAG: DUF1489 family protein [Alphaproteobacteria bacterium]